MAAKSKQSETTSLIPAEILKQSILFIHGQKVMLDETLAKLYQVETKILIRQIKRNVERFPEDFMFQLTKEEWNDLRCHFGTSKLKFLKARNGTSKTKRGGRRYASLCLYRTRNSHAFKCVAKQASRPGQY